MDLTEQNFKELLKTIAKKGGYEILKQLKDCPKRWNQLEKVVNDKQAVSYRIRELQDLGIIRLTIIRDTPTGSKAYELTPLGKKIVELIEEMKKEFEKYHSKAPSKDPKKFINELLDDD